MQALVQRQARHVDLDELRQILRQADHVEVGLLVRHDAALGLDADRDRLALEMNGNADADLLVLDHALQIDVHDRVTRGMALHVLEDRRLRLIADLDVQDRRVEALVVEQRQQFLMVEREPFGIAMTAVKNGRHFSHATQAAARTFALVVTELGAEFE